MAQGIGNFIDRIQIGTDDAHQIAIGSSAYAVCTTAANTAAKEVNIPGFALNTGTTIHIKFNNANSAASPTLNVSNTGAKAIMQYGTTNVGTAEETSGWRAGAVLTLTYDGTSWIRDQGYNTNTTYTNGTGLNLTNGAFSVKYGSTAGTAVEGNDSRLSDSRPPTSHTHGNITNDGKLQTTDVAIANGDKLVITDSSDSNKIARTSLSFDGATDDKALTQKGTWETFLRLSGGTMTGALKFSGNNSRAITWEDGTWYQRILTTDDSTTDTAVFTFQQTSNSGGDWTDLFTIKDNGTVIANTFSGSGASLTSLNASNISSGTVAFARLPTGTGASQVAIGNHTHGWANLTDNADSLSEGNSDWTDNTEILTSYASNNGFADTNAKGKVYRRDAIKAYNYIKGKLDSIYATQTTVNGLLAAADAMIFKGTLGTGGTITALPATHNAGWTYRVITAGTYAGKYCEVGTLIICIKDSTTAADADWTSVETNEDGSVIGPSSSTTNAIAKFSSTTGRVIASPTNIQIDNNDNLVLIGTVASDSTGSTATYDETRAGPKIIFNDGGQKAYLIGDRYDTSGDNQFGFTLGLVTDQSNTASFRANGIKATSKLVVNSTFDSTYAFKVVGSSWMNGILTLYRETTTANNYAAGIVFSNKDTTTTQTQNTSYIYAYNTHSADNNGMNMVIQSAGNVFIGGGESPANLYATLKTSTSENLYLTADSIIYFEGGCSNTIADRIGFALSSGNIVPVKAEAANNNKQNIGASDNKWANIYATTFNGALSGNATTATSIETAGTTAQFYRGDNSWSDTISGGTLKITNNSNTVTIGSQNANFTHIYNSATIPFIFNNSILTTSGNLGSSSYPFNNLYIGAKGAKGIYYVGTNSTNQMITFVDNTSDANGMGIKIGGGGVVVVGSGEASSLSVSGGDENLYLISDSNAYLEANAQTLSNRVGLKIDTNGHIIPVKAESANNNKQNLGASGNRWAKVYVGSADSYGDAYTPIYWNDGVPTAVTPIQYCAFTINSGKKGVKLTHAAFTAASYVTQIVVTSGESNLNSTIAWESAAGYINLTCSATSGAVSGYILVSRGGEVTATATDIT